jgi:hypothetical protein
MILHLSSSAVRGTIVFVAPLLGAALSHDSIRSARAEYEADLGIHKGYKRAKQLEPANHGSPKP